MNKYTFGDSLKELKDLKTLIEIAGNALGSISEYIAYYENEIKTENANVDLGKFFLREAREGAYLINEESFLILNILERIKDYIEKGPTEK